MKKEDRLLRVGVLGAGLIAQGAHLEACKKARNVELYAQEKFDARSWFVSVEFANGALGHRDLTLPVRMEWHEGFQVYGEHGGVVARSVNPRYFNASEGECFSTPDGQYRRPVGADGHTFRRQVEGFFDVILKGVSPVGAQVEDGLAALRALSAISHSYKTGQQVLLSEAPGEV